MLPVIKSFVCIFNSLSSRLLAYNMSSDSLTSGTYTILKYFPPHGDSTLGLNQGTYAEGNYILTKGQDPEQRPVIMTLPGIAPPRVRAVYAGLSNTTKLFENPVGSQTYFWQ